MNTHRKIFSRKKNFISAFVITASLGITLLINKPDPTASVENEFADIENEHPDNAIAVNYIKEEESEIDPHGMTLEELAKLGLKYGYEDLQKGLQYAELLNDDLARKYAFLEALFKAWSEYDPRGATEYIAALWSGNRLPFAEYLSEPLRAWAIADPAGAATRFQELTTLHGENFQASKFLKDVLTIWAEADPEQSFEWLHQTHDELREAEYLIESVITLWATENPLAALEQATMFESGSPERAAVNSAALSVWAESDARQAAQWFDQMIGTEDQAHLENAANDIGAELLAVESAETALQWIDEIEDDLVRTSSLETINFIWAEAKNTDEVLNTYKAKVGSGYADYKELLYTAAKDLSLENPEGVAGWLNAQEVLDDSSDKVIQGLTSALARDLNMYEIAYDWSTQIQDDKLREKTTNSLIKWWSGKQPETYKNWLNQNTQHMTPEFYKRLTEKVD